MRSSTAVVQEAPYNVSVLRLSSSFQIVMAQARPGIERLASTTGWTQVSPPAALRQTKGDHLRSQADPGRGSGAAATCDRVGQWPR